MRYTSRARHPNWSNSQRLNTLHPHSNDAKKVIDTQYTFVLSLFVFANQNLRRSTSQVSAASRLLHFRHVTKNPSLQLLWNLHLQTVTPVSPLESAFTQTAGCRTPHPPFLPLYLLFRAKSAFANPLFSMRCALFQVPYPVSPLLATLTKTAGCIPTIPILKLTTLRSQPTTHSPLPHQIG